MERRPLPRFRPLALLALVAYSLALFLSALPEPVRPARLDLASGYSEAILRRFLIRGGISVFEPPRERIVQVLRNDCIYVRGVGQDGARRWLQPDDGQCVTGGFRPRIPDLEWLLRSVLTGGEAFQTAPMQAAAIGDFFCHAPPWRELALREVELLWTQPTFDIDTRAEATRHVLLLRWRCDPPGVMLEQSPPEESQVRAFLEGRS